MLRKEDRLLLILVFSLAGGIFKIAGGIIYHSKSVLVDALTSMANLALKRPSQEHPAKQCRPSETALPSELFLLRRNKP